MIQITLAEGDRVEWSLEAFRRKVMKDGILEELRRRHYVKPSEARQLESETAQRRRRSAARRSSHC